MDTKSKGGNNRPKYEPVTLNPQALHHYFIAEEASLNLLKPLYESCQDHDRQSLVITDFDITPGETNSYQLVPRPKTQQFVSRLLKAPKSNTTVYLAGTEGFIWDTRNLAMNMGLDKRHIRMLEPISNTKRVICTHCFTVMDNVSERVVSCSGCHRELEVRNSFSKIHAAYPGVQANNFVKKSPATKDELF